MSVPRARFETAAARGNWGEAFMNLNALSMSEMLQSLSGLPRTTLDNLIMRRFAFKGGLDMPRMAYAWTVVKTGELPLVAPNDLLQTSQVVTAASFLKKAAPTGPRVTLKLIVFTDSIVTNRTLFGELKKKADEILAAQGNGFKLDVTVHGSDIALQEIVYMRTQFADMIEKAEKQVSIPSDRLIVLLVRADDKLDLHGIAVEIKGRRVAAIDTDRPNPDRATLLHEIGHCAGLPHAGEAPPGKPAPVDVGGDKNVMALAKNDVQRTTLTVTQGEFLAKAPFASK